MKMGKKKEEGWVRRRTGNKNEVGPKRNLSELPKVAK